DGTAYEREELFGPDLAVFDAPDEDAAVAFANATEYGLAASVHTRSREAFERCLSRIECGVVNWNAPTVGASGRLPFGGLKRSGSPLEAGYAHLELPGVGTAGVVDVPGHERFLRAMVGAAFGVDVAVLCVAADEGPMPQTAEHLDVLRLLGVTSGVVALTKSDLLPGLGSDHRELLLLE